MPGTALLLSALLLQSTPASGPQWQAWFTLNLSLNDPSPEHRQTGMAALAAIGEPDAEAVKRAENALQDSDPLVRQSAALALGEMHADASIPWLKQALNDSPEVAFGAAKALTKLGDSSGRDVLIAVMAGERKDAPGFVTNAQRKAREKMHHPQSLALLGAQDAAGAMFGPVAVVIPIVRETAKLRSKGGPGRASAAAYLAKDPDPYAISLLEWALNDEDELVRLEASKGLGERGNAGSVPKLVVVLGDTSEVVRDMAAASILRISDREGAPGTVSACPTATLKK
jgi:HEAT repeat protein